MAAIDCQLWLSILSSFSFLKAVMEEGHNEAQDPFSKLPSDLASVATVAGLYFLHWRLTGGVLNSSITE